MKGIQDTSSQTYRQLMGNGLTYSIPKFQRDYSWESQHWDDLWQDIESLYNKIEVAHYMGYLVLQTADNKNFEVIDGQQRLTTLSILILSVLKKYKVLEEKNIDKENNRKRRESFHNSYIGFLNPISLVSENKLKLNKNNDSFYRQVLVPIDKLPLRGLNSSEKLMKQCFEWFEKKLNDKFNSGEELATFIDSVVDKLFFTVITVSDELNAFKVFETLNARGVQLSSADLLKNYLFSVVDKEGSFINEITELESLWSKVISKLGNQKFPEFLRIFWNSRNKTTRQADLFKTIRKAILTKSHVFELIRELNEKADLYIALLNPDDEMWIGKENIKKRLKELKIFSVKQPLSLFLTSYEKLSEEFFEKTLNIVSIASFRYNIIGGLNPNEQERVYNQISLKILANGVLPINDFKEIYTNDDEFVTSFCNKEFKPTSRNHAIVRYIFGKLECHIKSQDINYESERYTIEHVLPENPSEEWDVSNDTIERCVYRLGNLCLLEKTFNKEVGNSGFTNKIESYKKSALGLTQLIAEEYSVWNENNISNRQTYLAKQAKTIWRYNFK